MTAIFRFQRTIRLTLLAWLSVAAVQAQPIPDEALRQGYLDAADTTYFVFDQSVYSVEPARRVVVTGQFRNWDQNMDLDAWRLAPHVSLPGVWVLAVPNQAYRALAPGTAFKFRIDDGRWLDPPADAINQEGGNLVYQYGVEPPRLRAELAGPRAVWAWTTGDNIARPLDPAAYRLTDSEGREIPVARVLPNTASRTLVVPEVPLDPNRVYFLDIPANGLHARARFDGWFRTLYSDKPLGAEIADGQTTFRVFAPRADAVRLYLYRTPDAGEEPYQTIEMKRDDVGVWEAVEDGDLHSVYYDFTVHGPSDPGNFFYETHPVHVSDPYARVNAEAQGRSRVWRPTTPADPLPNGRPAIEDVIAYEVHVQDFTDDLPVSDSLKGRFPAMTMRGLTNDRGEPVGFDYLLDLGINVVHLLPVQEFLHYPTDVWQATFADDAYMIEQGISKENYQWGYRTTHAFAIENRYRAEGTDYGAEREQFRNFVQAFHDAGIAVIIDLVPNHTGENMDGRHDLFNFNVFDKHYYYRLDENGSHIGPFGNEVKFEERPMTQRWLIDQCRALVEEFGIDGFRIDLAGQIDRQTLIKLRQELPADLIIYGEPWIPPSDPDVRTHPDWAWYKADAPITFFQDEARNAFGSPTSRPQNKRTDRGYPGGDGHQRPKVMLGLTNGWPDEVLPNRGINYLDIHDDWALADRYATNDWDGRQGVDEAPFRVAAGLLFTSLGPIVLHGGTEMMRSKGFAPLIELVKTLPDGTQLHIHGKRDTYNLRRANRFVWENVGRTTDTGPNDYMGMLAYWKGLIDFRRSEAGAVFRTAEAAPEGYYRWILPADERLLGYIVNDRVLVLVNVADSVHTFRSVDLPSGTWRLISNGEVVDHVSGIEGPNATLSGGRAHNITVPASSLLIWLRDEN